MADAVRPVLWIASSKKDFVAFPGEAQDAFGFALYQIQLGLHPAEAKPLTGLGSGVLELADEFSGNAYRAIYTVRFKKAVYVLHAFKKKSKRGIATPQADIDLVKRRLADAARHQRAEFGEEKQP